MYKLLGQKPWSRGYFTYKFDYIKNTINNPDLLAKFKNSQSLPAGYGYALDERSVEYPWVLSRINDLEAGNHLDAGSTLNYQPIIDFSGLKNKKITIINLNPEADCFWQKGVSYFFGDIRNMPFRDEYFNSINCLSTLEHIGMDNVIHTNDQKDKENSPQDFAKAVVEMKRVLKNGGTLLITVPFGKYTNFGWYQQFDSPMVQKVIEAFNPQRHNVEYYKYENKQWDISKAEACKDVEYSRKLGEDFAAAARAVACIELIK